MKKKSEVIEFKIKDIPKNLKKKWSKFNKSIKKNVLDYRIVVIILLSYLCILLTGVIVIGGLKSYQTIISLKNELTSLYNQLNEINVTEKVITIIPLLEQYLIQETNNSTTT